MSIQHVAAILDSRDARLSGCRKLVLVTLANRTDEYFRCWPSQERLAGECGISVRALSDHLKGLEEDGFITRDTQHLGQGNGSRTVYTLHLAALSVAPAEIAPEKTAHANSVVCTGSLLPLTNHQEPSTPSSSTRDARGTRLAGDWVLTNQWRAEAHQAAIKAKLRLTDEEIDVEADKFRDHWHSQPGSKARKLDWLGTWRNWIRRAAPEIVRARSRTQRPAGANGSGYGKPQSRFAPALSQHDAFAIAGAAASHSERGAGWEPDHGHGAGASVGPPRLEVIDFADAGGPQPGDAGGDRRDRGPAVLTLPFAAVG